MEEPNCPSVTSLTTSLYHLKNFRTQLYFCNKFRIYNTFIPKLNKIQFFQFVWCEQSIILVSVRTLAPSTQLDRLDLLENRVTAYEHKCYIVRYVNVQNCSHNCAGLGNIHATGLISIYILYGCYKVIAFH